MDDKPGCMDDEPFYGEGSVSLAQTIFERLDKTDKKCFRNNSVSIIYLYRESQQAYLQGQWTDLEKVRSYLEQKYRPSTKKEKTDDKPLGQNTQESNSPPTGDLINFDSIEVAISPNHVNEDNLGLNINENSREHQQETYKPVDDSWVHVISNSGKPILQNGQRISPRLNTTVDDVPCDDDKHEASQAFQKTNDTISCPQYDETREGTTAQNVTRDKGIDNSTSKLGLMVINTAEGKTELSGDEVKVETKGARNGLDISDSKEDDEKEELVKAVEEGTGSAGQMKLARAETVGANGEINAQESAARHQQQTSGTNLFIQDSQSYPEQPQPHTLKCDTFRTPDSSSMVDLIEESTSEESDQILTKTADPTTSRGAKTSETIEGVGEQVLTSAKVKVYPNKDCNETELALDDREKRKPTLIPSETNVGRKGKAADFEPGEKQPLEDKANEHMEGNFRHNGNDDEFERSNTPHTPKKTEERTGLSYGHDGMSEYLATQSGTDLNDAEKDNSSDKKKVTKTDTTLIETSSPTQRGVLLDAKHLSKPEKKSSPKPMQNRIEYDTLESEDNETELPQNEVSGALLVDAIHTKSTQGNPVLHKDHATDIHSSDVSMSTDKRKGTDDQFDTSDYRSLPELHQTLKHSEDKEPKSLPHALSTIQPSVEDAEEKSIARYENDNPEGAITVVRSKTPQPESENIQNKSSIKGFHEDLYLWLWYKKAFRDDLHKILNKHQCNVGAVLGNGKRDIVIYAISTSANFQDGKVDAEKCTKELREDLHYIRSKYSAYGASIPFLVYSKDFSGIHCPQRTYICEDPRGGTIIVGSKSEHVLEVWDYLHLKSHAPDLQSRSKTECAFGEMHKKRVTGDDDTHTADRNDVKEKFVPMQRHVYKYIGSTKYQIDITTLCSTQSVKLRPVNLEGEYGVLLTGRKAMVDNVVPEVKMFITKIEQKITQIVIDSSAVSAAGPAFKKAFALMSEICKGALYIENKDDVIKIIGDRKLVQDLYEKVKTICPSFPKPLEEGKETSDTVPASFKAKCGIKIHIFGGDITQLLVGAVVNTTDPNLQHGGEVADAIDKAAGPKLREECAKYIERSGELATSMVYMSGAHDMPCQCIIHVVVPRWREYTDKRQATHLLHLAFVNCLDSAEAYDQPSIAIPAIGSGLFGIPKAQVAQEMFLAVKTFVTKQNHQTKLQDILLVDINNDILKTLAMMFQQVAKEGQFEVMAPECDRFESKAKAKAPSAKGLTDYTHDLEHGDFNINISSKLSEHDL